MVESTEKPLPFAEFIGEGNEDDYFKIEYQRQRILKMQKERRYQTPDYVFTFELMLTSWFLDIPEDLEENWLIKCTPAGVRVLLVSQNKITVCYNLLYERILEFKSNFSAGGGDSDTGDGSTALDCIYHKNTKTFFVLDCLCWNDRCMINFDAELRFFVLKSKFIDYPTVSYCDNFNFVLVDYIPAQRSLIQFEMSKFFRINDEQYRYDGVTFYHKDSHYVFGKINNPLVGWLHSFMLKELLKIDVSPVHLVKRPKKYRGAAAYVHSLKYRKKLKKKRRRKNAEMEVVQGFFGLASLQAEEAGESEIDEYSELKNDLARFHKEKGQDFEEDLEIDGFVIV